MNEGHGGRADPSAEQLMDALARFDGAVEIDQELRFTTEQVLDEVRIVLADTARFLAANGDAGTTRASLQADMAAQVRDQHRPRSGRNGALGDSAGRYAHWLIERADRDSFTESLAAARAAAGGLPEEQELAGELREFIADRLNGRIDDAEMVRRIKKPRAAIARKRGRAGAAPPQAIVLDDAEQELAAMLGDALTRPSASAAWEAFMHFAMIPVTPRPPETLDDTDGDMLLFEWVFSSELSKPTFEVDLVRQLAVLGDGEPARLEQLRCAISLEPSADLERVGTGAIWSEPNELQRWIDEVQASAGFAAMLDQRTTVLGITVSRDQAE